MEQQRDALLDKQNEKTAKDAEQAKKEADEKAKDLAEWNKSRENALRVTGEELAILRAQSAGQTDLAAGLQKEKELREEITRLMSEGLSYTEAQGIAEEKQRLEQADKDRKFKEEKNPYLRRNGETSQEYFERTGRIDARPTNTDPTGGLHSGSSANRFRNTPTVEDMLDDAPSAAKSLGAAKTVAEKLAEAPDYVPTQFPSVFWPRPDGTTARQGISQGLPAPVAQGGDSASATPGDNGLTSAAQGAQQAAQQAANAASQTAVSSREAATAMQGMAPYLKNLQTQMSQVATDLQNLAGVVKSLQT